MDGPAPPQPGPWEDPEATHRRVDALCGSPPRSGTAGAPREGGSHGSPDSVRGQHSRARPRSRPTSQKQDEPVRESGHHGGCRRGRRKQPVTRPLPTRRLRPPGPRPCYLPSGHNGNNLPRRGLRTHKRQEGAARWRRPGLWSWSESEEGERSSRPLPASRRPQRIRSCLPQALGGNRGQRPPGAGTWGEDSCASPGPLGHPGTPRPR